MRQNQGVVGKSGQNTINVFQMKGVENRNVAKLLLDIHWSTKSTFWGSAQRMVYE